MHARTLSSRLVPASTNLNNVQVKTRYFSSWNPWLFPTHCARKQPERSALVCATVLQKKLKSRVQCSCIWPQREAHERFTRTIFSPYLHPPTSLLFLLIERNDPNNLPNLSENSNHYCNDDWQNLRGNFSLSFLSAVRMWWWGQKCE